jgi:hypothetical protein
MLVLSVVARARVSVQQPRFLAWRGGEPEPGHEPVVPSLFHVRVRVCLGCGALWLRLSIAVAEEGLARVK